METSLPSINLISKRREQYDKKVVVVNKSKLFSGIVLAVYVMIVIAVFSWGFLVSQQAASVENNLNKVQLEIASKSGLEQQWRQMISKTNTLNELLQKRMTISSLWQQIHTIFPAEVEVTRFDYKQDSLHVTLRTPHFISSSQVLDIFEQDQVGLKVSQDVIHVYRSMDATYTIDVVMKLGSSKKNSEKI